MSRMILKMVILGSTLLFLQQAYCFEEPTHQKISESAYNDSKIIEEIFFENSGFSGLNPAKDRIFLNSRLQTDRELVTVLRDGAEIEDQGFRVANHFYDPVNDEAMLPPAFVYLIPDAGIRYFLLNAIHCEKSPDWALEDVGEVTPCLGTSLVGGSLIPSDDTQEFSLRDGYDYLYKALTLTEESERNKYFGRTFETLGHVVHHIQDMAQPQHTRNDEHLNLSDQKSEFVLSLGELPLEHHSRFEIYSEKKYASRPLDDLTPRSNGYFAKYPPVRFGDARSYWHTEDGKGLADYSNRGFVSSGTNCGNEKFPSPVCDVATLSTLDLNVLLDPFGGCGQSDLCGPGDLPGGGAGGILLPPPPDLPVDGGDKNPKTQAELYAYCETHICKMSFLENTVVDKYAPEFTATNQRMTSYSVFTEDLIRLRGAGRVPRPPSPIYSLNRFNFDAAHEFLIPRATAYSAGLIDYFLRGKLEIENIITRDDLAEIVLRNVSKTNEISFPLGEGGFSVVYDAKDGTRKHTVLVDPPVFSTQNPLPVGQTVTLQVVLPNDVDYTKEQPFLLVFKGIIGSEPGVASVSLTMESNFHGFVVTPSFEPGDGIADSRLVRRGQYAPWMLDPKAGQIAGNTDWKGMYVNGKPTEVLTWQGLSGRHYGAGSYGFVIYRGGSSYALAPYPVLGAAFNKDSEGLLWLFAVTYQSGNYIVLKKPAKRDASSAWYDADTKPDGWRIVSTLAFPQNVIGQIKPWFFNGSGTEAQTLRQVQLAEGETGSKTARLKISATDEFSSMSLLENGVGITRVKHSEKTYETGFTDVNGSPKQWTRAAASSSSSASGSYIVAVDYLDDQEVKCVYLEQNGGTATESADSDEANSTYHYQHRVQNDIAEELQCNGVTVPLFQLRQDNTTDITTGSGAASGNVAVSELQEIRNLAFIDPRAGVIASFVHSGYQSESSLAPETDNNGSLTGFGTGTIASKTYVADHFDSTQVHEKTFYSETMSNQNRTTINTLLTSGVGNDSRDTTEHFYPNMSALFASNSAEGSWVTDVDGNLFVTHPKGIYFWNAETQSWGTGEQFNALYSSGSAVNLETVFGSLPEDAGFYPVGLQ